MYLVTGATGNVGRSLVEQLLAAGAQVRAISRRPRSARLPGQVDVVGTDGDTYPLDDVTGVFVNATAVGLFTDTTAAARRLGALLGHAASHGVRRVVLLSSSSTLDDASPVGRHHRTLERQVQDSGLAWTVLRPGVFNSNTLAWARTIRTDGVVRSPFAQARIAPIDERDIAAVAARALLSDGGADLDGAVAVLSGPETLTPMDQARAIGHTIGRPVRFEEAPPEAMRRELTEAGEPRWAVDGLLRYYTQAVTQAVEISSAVADITGRPPRTFADWASDHAAIFRSAVTSPQNGTGRAPHRP